MQVAVSTPLARPYKCTHEANGMTDFLIFVTGIAVLGGTHPAALDDLTASSRSKKSAKKLSTATLNKRKRTSKHTSDPNLTGKWHTKASAHGLVEEVARRSKQVRH